MSERSSNRIFVVLVLIGVLSVGGIAATIWISVSNDVSDGYIPLEERDGHRSGEPGTAQDGDELPDEGGEAGGGAPPGPSGRREPRGPVGGSPGAAAFDEDALAHMLTDGGTEQAPVRLDPVRRIGPTTPDRQLGRAHFWQGMLDTQVGELRSRLNLAREAGNEGLARRLERQVARLEAQRGPLEARIAELEDAVEGAPEADDGEALAPGE